MEGVFRRVKGAYSVVGLVAGYVRPLDGFLMRIMDGLMSIPEVLIAIALMALTRASMENVIFAITVAQVPRVTRLVIAARYLTILPIPGGSPAREGPGAAAAWFPVVGLAMLPGSQPGQLEVWGALGGRTSAGIKKLRAEHSLEEANNGVDLLLHYASDSSDPLLNPGSRAKPLPDAPKVEDVVYAYLKPQWDMKYSWPNGAAFVAMQARLHAEPEEPRTIDWTAFPSVRGTLAKWGLLEADSRPEAVGERLGKSFRIGRGKSGLCRTSPAMLAAAIKSM